MSSSSSSSSSTPSLVESLLQLSLTDLIKSLRSSPSPSLLSTAVSSSLHELRSSDTLTVSIALNKLSFLSSLHFLPPPPSSFFSALSLLPSPILPHKRLAYLFSILHFHPSSTDLLPLTTHQLHKDLLSPSPSLALSLLSSASSPDLSRHLAPDLLPLLSPSRPPSVRRKATSASLSVLALSPDSAAVIFPKLVQNLADPATLASAVNILCELTAADDPRPYLPLAPDLYKILTQSKNNWVLIKVVKIFARLGAVEPRIRKRVADPICDLIKKSSAKSLVFECVRAVLISSPEDERAVRVAVEKVKEGFLSSEEDANLRYLGLHALSMLEVKDSWAVEENREVVVRSLSDLDHNIRREALRLVMGMVFGTNVVEISVLLIGYALKSDPEFANEILEAILATCGRNYYEIVQDFDWYVSVLGDMARNPHCEKGEEIERQLVDIGLRVRDARPELVRVARDLLIDPALLGNHFLDRILSAAAWVSGEYVEFSKNPLELLEALLQPMTDLLPSAVRAVYIQAVFKVIVFCVGSYIEQVEANANVETSDLESEDDVNTPKKLMNRKPLTHESILHMIYLVETAVGPLFERDEVDVQERARNVLGFIQMLKEIPDWKTEEGFRKDSKIQEIVGLVKGAFSEELGPVSVNAQQKVPVPEGLILHENLADLTTILGDDDIIPNTSASFCLRNHHHREIEDESEPSVESTALLAEHRKRHGLYYLPKENDSPGSNDYPKANDPLLSASNNDSTNDLLKLTDKSLIPKKAKSSKPRPVVVKLDEGDSPSTSLKPMTESKDDMLSGAIRDVLLGNKEKVPASRSKGTVADSEATSHSKENVGEIEQGSSSSRSRHNRHGKDSHRSHREKEVSKGEHKKSSSSHHEKQKHKHRQRRDAPLDVASQAPVIQDFLL